MKCSILSDIIAVETESPRLAAVIDTLTCCFAPSGRAPTLSYRLRTDRRARLYRNGASIYESRAWQDLAPAFELDLYEQVLLHSSQSLSLHAAALCKQGRAVVFCGPSGSGKSTLAWALVEKGCAYISDEWAVLDSPGSVRGITRPIALAPDAGLMPAADSPLVLHQVEILQQSGSRLVQRLLQPPWSALQHAPAQLAGVVLLAGRGHNPPRLTRLSSAQALDGIWANVLRPDRQAMKTALDSLAQVGVYELVAGELAETCEAVTALW